MSHDPSVREFEYTDQDFDVVRGLIYQAAGIRLADSKRQLVYSRIARRIRALKLQRFRDYLQHLQANEHELEEFINALTTNLTSFFREPHHFDYLRDYFLQHHRPGKKFKVWCAAASTGEEPYTLAITAIEAFQGYTPPVEITATDIDSQVLATADLGVYAEERIERMDAARKKKFFLRGKGRQSGMVKVRPEVRALVEFDQLNLLGASWPLSPPYDAIFCRNVMIYFDKETQLKILRRMMPMLHDEGIYVAGHSESFSEMSGLLKSLGRTIFKPAGR
ncbi:CheR family methyltransferase [Gilvimarinus sp. SDUM040013]|uniref:Chemotaxis protein methyltransferase n=1 Tax=Gilvimarinus gilvus TaxID=3058038 RepID=A0ABU4RSU8_9GAMM|nr:CheR family methyltransferase [Gilvimarinus sp. SDUM040013]MDO3388420.1 CheR family methyltransferase [Gilvimarinus sp. SDUM040013]MDX6847970.1 CheR family methyltransferase [Gilvimarinus sp. SDUM040013]